MKKTPAYYLLIFSVIDHEHQLLTSDQVFCKNSSVLKSLEKSGCISPVGEFVIRAYRNQIDAIEYLNSIKIKSERKNFE